MATNVVMASICADEIVIRTRGVGDKVQRRDNVKMIQHWNERNDKNLLSQKKKRIQMMVIINERDGDI